VGQHGRMIAPQLAIAAALALGAPARAHGPTPLEPAGPWQVDYGDSQCVAARAFKDADKDVTIGFVPAPVLGGAQVILIRQGFAAGALQQDVRLQGKGGVVNTSMIDYPAGKGRKMVSRITLRPTEYQTIAQDGALRIKFAGFDRAFALYNMAGVARELDACVKELHELWAMSPERTAQIATPAKPVRPLRDLFGSEDYPAQALREHNSGVVGVRMMIDQTGAVKNCTATETSGSAILDAMACYVLQQHAKFHPAMDAAGKPLRSFEDQHIRWLIAGPRN
jgi:TonB family protein